MPRRQCSLCGAVFEARRSDAKFCTPKCRQKHFQNSVRQPAIEPQKPQKEPDRSKLAAPGGVEFPRAEADRAAGRLVASVTARLEAIGQVESVSPDYYHASSRKPCNALCIAPNCAKSCILLTIRHSYLGPIV
jgi:predicted  nucleic acid-binding Zn-ribbon protein